MEFWQRNACELHLRLQPRLIHTLQTTSPPDVRRTRASFHIFDFIAVLEPKFGSMVRTRKSSELLGPRRLRVNPQRYPTGPRVPSTELVGMASASGRHPFHGNTDMSRWELDCQIQGNEIVVSLPDTGWSVTFYKSANSPQLLTKARERREAA